MSGHQEATHFKHKQCTKVQPFFKRRHVDIILSVYCEEISSWTLKVYHHYRCAEPWRRSENHSKANQPWAWSSDCPGSPRSKKWSNILEGHAIGLSVDSPLKSALRGHFALGVGAVTQEKACEGSNAAAHGFSSYTTPQRHMGYYKSSRGTILWYQ